GDDGGGGHGETDLPFGNSPRATGDGAPGGAGSGAGDSGGQGSPAVNGLPIHGGIIPMFPGGGTSDEARPLANAGLCDYVAGAPVDNVGSVTRCFFGPEDDTTPAATIEQILEFVEGKDTLRVRLTFDPSFVDNTYGEGSIGWEDEKEGLREFKKLVGSDHAEILVI
ncbi:MAG: hypothetical protein OXT09_15075, partial [Myxococcales bacterium]|nr:hypothetical protein [Myxococcales bacterium]